MASNSIIGNRNSTPDSLRPPSSRTPNNGHHLRASADMSPFSPSPLSAQNMRPSSEVYYSQSQRSQNANHADDAMDKAAQQWIADIDQYENILEEMAGATLDQDFKDELSAIEQWFKVLSEAERTAALYALLQQTTQVQIRFFIQVLQEMAKGHPMSGVLSPSSFNEKDVMTNRMSEPVGKLGMGDRNSIAGRPPPSPGAKRNSGLDASTINAMFPDAANAIAKKKAEYTQQTGNAPPPSNRNSTVGASDRTSLVAPTISAPTEAGGSNGPQPSPTPWGQRNVERPKSSSGNQPMGQFAQPPGSAGLRANRPAQLNQNALKAGETEQPLLSPYNANASWASMTNTPMVANFNQPQANTQADMVANATAMKLAALSTVNNRIMLDDVRKYRRSRSTDRSGPGGAMPNAGLPGNNVVVVNENGQLVNSQLNPTQLQMALQMQQQQQAQAMANRSRPNSPGLAMGGAMGGNNIGFASPQNNGFLAAGLIGGMAGLNLGQYGGGGGGPEGYMSDHSDMNRGRSPRGRRGTSKPPEDPTDPTLLQDIPAWLRSLRLHKYTDNLKDIKWEDLVELDDKGLEDRGVNALGARRKMLKVFEQVREAKSAGKI